MTRITVGALGRIINEEVRPLLAEHDKILIRGNGEPSLQEKLRRIEDYIREDRENRKYYSRLFVTIAVTNLFSLVFAVVIWFAKIYPVILELEKTTQQTGL